MRSSTLPSSSAAAPRSMRDSSCSIGERLALHTNFRQQVHTRGASFFIQMGEDLVDDQRILDANDHPSSSTPFAARLDLDIGKPVQPVCTAQRASSAFDAPCGARIHLDAG